MMVMSRVARQASTRCLVAGSPVTVGIMSMITAVGEGVKRCQFAGNQ